MIPKATNNWVWIIRDKIEDDKTKLFIPTASQAKPHEGTIQSAGELVKDKKIRAGKKCLWHPTVGFEIIYNETTYVVMECEKVLATL